MQRTLSLSYIYQSTRVTFYSEDNFRRFTCQIFEGTTPSEIATKRKGNMTIFNLDIGIVISVPKFTVVRLYMYNINIIPKDNPRGTNRSIRACAPYRPDRVAVPASMVPLLFIFIEEHSIERQISSGTVYINLMVK
jgi:hypothetical protein